MTDVAKITMFDHSGNLAEEMEADAVRFGFTILSAGEPTFGLSTYEIEGEWSNLLDFANYYELEFDDE